MGRLACTGYLPLGFQPDRYRMRSAYGLHELHVYCFNVSIRKKKCFRGMYVGRQDEKTTETLMFVTA